MLRMIQSKSMKNMNASSVDRFGRRADLLDGDSDNSSTFARSRSQSKFLSAAEQKQLSAMDQAMHGKPIKKQKTKRKRRNKSIGKIESDEELKELFEKIKSKQLMSQ